jgi:hypothetical protein
MNTSGPFELDDLRCLLAGEAAQVKALSRLTPERFLEVAERLPESERTLAGVAVARVLQGLLTGDVTPSQVQAWASLMRRGFLSAPTYRGPTASVNLVYEPQREEAIVEAISRMDELGDMVDGTMDNVEIRLLIGQLES